MRQLLLSGVLFILGCGHPRVPAQPRPLLDKAWADFQLREFDLALQGFEKVSRKTTESGEFRAEALYGEASCWNLRREGRDPARARKLFQEVREVAPTGPFASWAALDAVRTRHLFTGDDAVDERELAAGYASVVEQYPGTPAATEAFLYQCDMKFLMARTPEEFSEVRGMLTEFAEKNPDNPYLSQVFTALQRVYQQLEDPQNELKMAIRALETAETDPTNPKLDVTKQYWTIAQLAQYQLGDFDTARQYYGRFIAEYPTDQRVFTIQRLLLEMDRMETAGGPP